MEEDARERLGEGVSFMHELGIMTGVMDAVCSSAEEAGATSVTSISLSVGEMTECIHEALVFAFEALQELSEYRLCAHAQLNVNIVEPESVCLECGEHYKHDRFHVLCPACGSFATELIAGREMRIDSIEIETPDEDDESDGAGEAGKADEPSEAKGAASADEGANGANDSSKPEASTVE